MIMIIRGFVCLHFLTLRLSVIELYSSLLAEVLLTDQKLSIRKIDCNESLCIIIIIIWRKFAWLFLLNIIAFRESQLCVYDKSLIKKLYYNKVSGKSFTFFYGYCCHWNNSSNVKSRMQYYTIFFCIMEIQFCVYHTK